MDKNDKSKFIKKIVEHTKIKYEELVGLSNISECSINCKIDYKNDTAIIKKDVNEYTIDYQHVGVYDLVSKTWFWSCGFYPSKTKKTKISKTIRKNILNIIQKNSTSELIEILTQNDIELLSYLIKNAIYLDDDNLEILVKICLYMSDVVWILPHKNDSQIVFIAIIKILGSK